MKPGDIVFIRARFLGVLPDGRSLVQLPHDTDNDENGIHLGLWPQYVYEDVDIR